MKIPERDIFITNGQKVKQEHVYWHLAYICLYVNVHYG